MPPAMLTDFKPEEWFVADLAVEFVGAVPLRLEFDTANRWVWIRAGEAWGVFAVDAVGLAALKECVASAVDR